VNATALQESYKLLDKVIFLKKVPLFASVQTADLRALALIVEELDYQSGEEIVKEGEFGDSMYVIKEGRVSITKNVAGGKSVALAQLAAGDCFGDMSVVDAEVRSANVIAERQCTLLRIKRDDLIDAINECPQIAFELLKVFVMRLRKANTVIEGLSTRAKTE